ncbi:Hsp70 family protein [Oxalobacteraceae bacterium R-40]|uniref:Hsp70 family protein n=1 Tax=Keguizhuia sedimenti TaxID=3064264 RepID=A0ABU1BR21_9BURK|nr:Hsp70 family protein [Oxalobacteraceae bacterium R-40]
MANACGIDFGTSNSTVGWCKTADAVLLPLEDGKVTLPSVVFFNAEENAVAFGRAALSEYLAGYEGRLMRSLKSLLGTSLIDAQTEVLGRALPFRMLLAQFITELKRRAEAATGRSFSQAVFGRPVFFIDGNPAADRIAQDTLQEIAHEAGFREIVFQFEPIAAAFDYESRIESEELVMIADIGGGTSDFSLVRLSPDRIAKADRRDDILANGGVHIGGTDFDKYLSLSSFMPLLGMGSKLRNGNEIPSTCYFNLATWHTINFAYTPRIWTELQDIYRDACERGKLDSLFALIKQREGHWLALKAEEGKIALSASETVGMNLERLTSRQNLMLDREHFNLAVEHLVEEIGKTVSTLLLDAGISAQSIDTVFFTGGSSGVPLLRDKVASLLPSARRVEGDLFGSIGAGLALDAARKFG